MIQFYCPATSEVQSLQTPACIWRMVIAFPSYSRPSGAPTPGGGYQQQRASVRGWGEELRR